MGVFSRPLEVLREWTERDDGTLEGPALSTEEINGTGRPYSTADDFGDVSVYKQQQSPGSTTEYTLLNVTDGPKVLDSVFGLGDQFNLLDGSNPGSMQFTIDGTTSNFPGTSVFGEDRGGNIQVANCIPSLRYDSSLKIDWEHSGTGNTVTVVAYVYGSGPEWAAVVKDGEGPYSTARNVNDDQIDGMDAPDGYRIVKNPAVADDVSDVWQAVWDGSHEMFVAQ